MPSTDAVIAHAGESRVLRTRIHPESEIAPGLPVRLEHPPDLSQFAWIRHGRDARDQAIPNGKRKHRGDSAPAEGNDAGLAIYVPGGHGGSRGCAEEAHELLGDQLAADVRPTDRGQRPTGVRPSNN
jgi:hypothetical protein